MAGSLLAHLYPRIRGSQEDVATLSLNYIIRQSEIARAAFTTLISKRLSMPPDPSIIYNTQVVGNKKERPDIVGTDEKGTEKIICEAKFFAALTENQPNAYLDRLKGIENSGLIFLCPESRLVGMWGQIVSLAGSRITGEVSDYCVDLSGAHMGIVSWTDVLDTLLMTADNGAPDIKDDLLQLIGFCQEIENNSFIPFKPEDFGADVAISMDRYYMVVDAVIDKLLSRSDIKASTNKLRSTALWNGLARYIIVEDFTLGIVFNREMWKKTTSIESPFWLSLHDGRWNQTPEIMAYYSTLPERMTENRHNGISYVALEAPLAATLDETAEELVKQILFHVFALKKRLSD